MFSEEKSSSNTESNTRSTEGTSTSPEIRSNVVLDITLNDEKSQSRINLSNLFYEATTSKSLKIRKSNIVEEANKMSEEEVLNDTDLLENLDIEDNYTNIGIAIVCTISTVMLALVVMWTVRIQKTSHNNAPLNENAILRQKESDNANHGNNEDIKARCTYKRASGQASMTSGQLLIIVFKSYIGITLISWR